MGNPLITTSEKKWNCKNYHEGTITIVIIFVVKKWVITKQKSSLVKTEGKLFKANHTNMIILYETSQKKTLHSLKLGKNRAYLSTHP